MPWTSSILFCRLKLMKFVSTITRYGGPSAVLCEKKSEEACAVMCRTGAVDGPALPDAPAAAAEEEEPPCSAAFLPSCWTLAFFL